MNSHTLHWCKPAWCRLNVQTKYLHPYFFYYFFFCTNCLYHPHLIQKAWNSNYVVSIIVLTIWQASCLKALLCETNNSSFGLTLPMSACLPHKSNSVNTGHVTAVSANQRPDQASQTIMSVVSLIPFNLTKAPDDKMMETLSMTSETCLTNSHCHSFPSRRHKVRLGKWKLGKSKYAWQTTAWQTLCVCCLSE